MKNWNTIIDCDTLIQLIKSDDCATFGLKDMVKQIEERDCVEVVADIELALIIAKARMNKSLNTGKSDVIIRNDFGFSLSDSR